MLQLFTAPSSTTFLSDAGGWSVPLFTALIVFAAVIVGILIGGMFVAKLQSSVVKAVGKLTGRRGGGRRRR